MKDSKQLPEPSDDLKLQSERLSKKIQASINRNQSLKFSQYMQMALYHPQYGYYTSSLPKFGAVGDFITAPEISPLFSHCLARFSAQVFEELEHKNILEFGAGQGTMAKDILLELARLDVKIDHYYILEVSGDLIARQQENLQSALPPELFAKVTWLQGLPEKPIEAVVLANEVLDAMPFERIRIEPEQSLIGHVVYADDAFKWNYQPIIDAKLQKFANQLIHFLGKVSHLGYETEINLNLEPWFKSLSQSMTKGAVLLIDYGYAREEYYQPARVMGTMRCHYQHRAHSNPFFYPGTQDITAHVDFTAVAEAGYDNGFKVAGFTTQANFLLASGLMEMSLSPDAEMIEQLKVAQQIKTLTMPDEMGETFKVMALSKKLESPVQGFSIRDLRHQL